MNQAELNMSTTASKEASMAYDNEYSTEPIGGGNPYYRCVHCKRSVPEINGDIAKHEQWCPYRLMKEEGHDRLAPT